MPYDYGLRKNAGKRQPEAILQEKIIRFLKARDWLVKPTIGSSRQAGFPDLYCAHLHHGTRWVEVKRLPDYAFTPAQLEWFPKFSAFGVGIYVITAATEDEYKKLFKPANWHTFLSEFKNHFRPR